MGIWFSFRGIVPAIRSRSRDSEPRGKFWVDFAPICLRNSCSRHKRDLDYCVHIAWVIREVFWLPSHAVDTVSLHVVAKVGFLFLARMRRISFSSQSVTCISIAKEMALIEIISIKVISFYRRVLLHKWNIEFAIIPYFTGFGARLLEVGEKLPPTSSSMSSSNIMRKYPSTSFFYSYYQYNSTRHMFQQRSMLVILSSWLFLDF